MRFRFLFFFILFTFSERHISVFGSDNGEVAVLVGWVGERSDLWSSVFSEWKKDDVSACEWDYVECDEEGFVSGIDVRDVELSLPFPAGFASLQRLRSLVISGCNLSGEVPDGIGKFGALQVLDVSSNRLVGAIPAAIGRLRSLQELVLNSNQLTGRIPGEIGACVALRSLIVFDNYLSGELPMELGNLASLEVLRAGGNNDISGTIPSQIGNCPIKVPWRRNSWSRTLKGSLQQALT
uniref:Disease resistance R13L4/SHOC-2-like LRR domain-containing protein n=1 Tax=Kalanchoe fedtschenkoi TaxID=63787 RepID=A0A7N0SZL9_KALFE